jgi:hypothetical protein
MHGRAGSTGPTTDAHTQEKPPRHFPRSAIIAGYVRRQRLAPARNAPQRSTPPTLHQPAERAVSTERRRRDHRPRKQQRKPRRRSGGERAEGPTCQQDHERPHGEKPPSPQDPCESPRPGPIAHVWGNARPSGQHRADNGRPHARETTAPHSAKRHHCGVSSLPQRTHAHTRERYRHMPTPPQPTTNHEATHARTGSTGLDDKPPHAREGTVQLNGGAGL